MRRPPHGATARPGPSGPASGYGREVGRPGPEVLGPQVVDPIATTAAPPVLEPSWFSDPPAGAETPAPVTP